MRIAVDAMGGDHAPREIVDGVVQAARELHDAETIFLVGDEARLVDELDKHSAVPPHVEIVHASQVVEMGESPAQAIRRKKDSSISRSLDLVKEGRADAVFSAGSTGAAVAGATLKLRTLDNISRPAIATVFPTPTTPFLLLDAGANTDCTGLMIAQFGLMGSIYATEILGIESPRVGVLSIGGEDAKGNETSKLAFKLLSESGLNFIGNVESRDLFEGRVDVVACDGFVGNVVLKTSESVAKAMGSWLRDSFTKNFIRKIGAGLLSGALKEIRQTSDPEAYGGAPLLGVRGTVIIGHGSSSAHAVRNAVRVAADAISHRLNQRMSEGAAKIGESE